ncbi:hypothetical protein BDK51DRAFT_27999 [Blyttiomyces helicus]|uniref:Uncharacterized protein n=1 Tax=Blyttiomyces helicus TaxID=388810 RepID=A0A4P9WB50_9FUNG|nr:hypothetical protein BDK51DRAFT_27999 [Blyttiomyces helicus]|eukprot:RKO87496.1 hypothetical protein BDK51DRAFT_27999 [Blyttiomyces helicus]
MTTLNLSRFLVDTDPPICKLDAKKHFDALTSKERLYAHYIGRASWVGRPILSYTISAQSPALYDLFLAVFSDSSASPLKAVNLDTLKKQAAVSEEVFKGFVEYGIQVLFFVSNYKSFGDTKFIPRIPADEMEKIIKATGSTKALQSQAHTSSSSTHRTKSEPSPRMFPGNSS